MALEMHKGTDAIDDCSGMNDESIEKEKHQSKVPRRTALMDKDPEFISGLRYQFQRMKRDDSNIEDVCDVALYQRDLLNEFYFG